MRVILRSSNLGQTPFWKVSFSQTQKSTLAQLEGNGWFCNRSVQMLFWP